MKTTICMLFHMFHGAESYMQFEKVKNYLSARFDVQHSKKDTGTLFFLGFETSKASTVKSQKVVICFSVLPDIQEGINIGEEMVNIDIQFQNFHIGAKISE